MRAALTCVVVVYPYQCLGAGQGKPGMKGVVVVTAASSSGGIQGGS